AGYFIQHLQRAWLDGMVKVMGLEVGRYPACKSGLIELVFQKSDAKSCDLCSGSAGHHGDNCGRVHATAKKRAQRHVAHQSDPGGLFHAAEDSLTPFLLRTVLLGTK